MTPQTAAALRALETEIRTYDPFGPAKHNFQDWSDRLAAVLTQEGAGEEIDWVVHFPPAEPRAAEGAGTTERARVVLADIDREWDSEEDCDAEAIIECLGDDAQTLLEENPEDERARNMFRAAKLIEQLIDNTEPTAAAAVPDAVAWRYRYRLVATHKWSKWEFIDEHGNAKLRRMLRDELTTPELCEVESLYRAPAPRGGVTEADFVWPQWPVMAFNDDCVMCKGSGIVTRAPGVTYNPCSCGKYLPPKRITPPAAQAQDEGPMAPCQS